MVRWTSRLALCALITLTELASSLLIAADPPAKAQPDSSLDARIAALRRERFELARTSYERLAQADEWMGSEKAFAAAERLLEAELASSDDAARQAEMLERHLGRITLLKMRLNIAFQAGRIPVSDTPPFFHVLDYAAEDMALRIYHLRHPAKKGE
jgi:hypothetical protein